MKERFPNQKNSKVNPQRDGYSKSSKESMIIHIS